MLRRSMLSGAAAALALLVAASCDTPAGVAPADAPALRRDSGPGASQADLLQAVKQATARRHSTTQAMAAGYVPDAHCVAHPTLGGMGYHWVNPALVDPAFDPLQPEVLLYEDGPNGQRKLVAVEYIVIDVGQPRPSFAGELFTVGGTPVPAAHWSLHVWLYRDNPAGMFTAFNPDVSCP